MKNPFKYTLLALLVCVVFSCFLTSCRSTIRQETQKSESNTTTTEVKESYRDTTFFAPKSETTIKIPISDLGFKSSLNTDLDPKKKPKVYSQKNGQARAEIIYFHDTITVVASCDSLAIVAKIKSELIRESKTSAKTESSNKKEQIVFSFLDLLIAFSAGFLVCYLLKLFKIIP